MAATFFSKSTSARKRADARSKAKRAPHAHGSKRSCNSGRFVSKKRSAPGCK